MRYLVDQALCSGHGLCVVQGAGVYEVDEEGFNRHAGSTVSVPAGQEQSAERGAASCPEQAIRILPG